MRWTPQRRTIVEVLADASGHVSGAELIERCRGADPTTIPSTVYRTLDVLEELGLVRHGHAADGREEFHVAQEPEHGHLYCASCGRRWEVGSAQAEAIMAAFRQIGGFQPDLSHMAVVGRCAECGAAAGITSR